MKVKSLKMMIYNILYYFLKLNIIILIILILFYKFFKAFEKIINNYYNKLLY